METKNEEEVVCILSNTYIPNYIRAKQLINFHEHVFVGISCALQTTTKQ